MLNFNYVIEQIEYDSAFQKYLGDNHYPYTSVPTIGYYAGHYEKLDKDSSVFLGSVITAEKLIRDGWPHIWLNDKFRWTAYAPKLGNLLINSDALCVTLGDLLEQWGDIDHLKHGSAFVRPDSYKKIFSGMAIHKDGKASFEDALSFYGVENPATPVIISSVKEIVYEYRFICYADWVVTGCQYMKDGDLLVTCAYTQDAFRIADLAIDALSEFLGVPFFVVDVGKYEGLYGVVEINAFNTSGFYACSPHPINDMLCRYFMGQKFKNQHTGS